MKNFCTNLFFLLIFILIFTVNNNCYSIAADETGGGCVRYDEENRVNLPWEGIPEDVPVQSQTGMIIVDSFELFSDNLYVFIKIEEKSKTVFFQFVLPSKDVDYTLINSFANKNINIKCYYRSRESFLSHEDDEIFSLKLKEHLIKKDLINENYQLLKEMDIVVLSIK